VVDLRRGRVLPRELVLDLVQDGLADGWLHLGPVSGDFDFAVAATEKRKGGTNKMSDKRRRMGEGEEDET
jgi:hypothetical protein